MARALTTLGAQGIITDPIRKMDILLKTFYAADASQSSYTTMGSVKSLPKIVLQYEPNADLEDAVRTSLQELMRPYFDNVEIGVKLEKTDAVIDENAYSINISLKVYQDGKGYDSTDTRSIKNSFVEVFG